MLANKLKSDEAKQRDASSSRATGPIAQRTCISHVEQLVVAVINCGMDPVAQCKFWSIVNRFQ